MSLVESGGGRGGADWALLAALFGWTALLLCAWREWDGQDARDGRWWDRRVMAAPTTLGGQTS